eukprot:snap_masked-scaffold_9-processed-gene-10.48-mRNA-1 protein AED:0.22 eAED:0.22 QI:42/0/0.5/1/0/0.5/2/84/207
MSAIYFTSTSCGAASFISAKAGGLEFAKKVPVDIRSHKLLGTDEDYYKINPKGNVPAIKLEDGTLFNENVGTLYYIAKNAPKKNLLGEGSEEFVIVNLLGYLNSEVHKAHGGMFRAQNNEERQAVIDNTLAPKYKYLKENYFKSSKYLVGKSFSVADAYLYVMTFWPQFFGLEMVPEAKKFREAMKDEVAIKEAQAEMDKLEADAKA